MTLIQLSRHGHVLKAVIDKPGDDLNRVDAALHLELVHLFAQLREEADARAVLLTANGRAFSAGGDFNWMPALREPGALEDLRRHARQMINDLLDVPLPIVAAVNGPAIGLGATIALLCDCIVAADTATFADTHVRVASSPATGARWPGRSPWGRPRPSAIC